MKNLTVARRYAKALFELANEQKSLDDVLQGMSNLSHAIMESEQLGRTLFNPLVRPEEKRDAVAKITSNKLILQFVMLLAKRERLVDFDAIFSELRSLADKANGINRILVKTPSALNDDQKKNIENALAQSMGGRILGKFEVEKDLIGGVWIKMGDKVLDATLKGRMDDMRYTLTHSKN